MGRKTSPINKASWGVRDEIIKRYITIEGGKVHIKDDLGGLTYVGGARHDLIVDYKKLWPKYGYTGVGDPTLEMTIEIFVEEFWNKNWLDHFAALNPDLAEVIYGWALNSGSGYPVKVIQTHLNVMNLKGARYDNIKVDGGMGPNTFEMVETYLETCKNRRPLVKLAESVMSAQWSHYLNISAKRAGEANETFTDGWFNRALDKRERLDLV